MLVCSTLANVRDHMEEWMKVSELISILEKKSDEEKRLLLRKIDKLLKRIKEQESRRKQ